MAALALLGVYMVRDNAGKDRAEPVIKVDGDRIEVSVKDGEEALMQGVTAEDAEDGDLTDKVIVESIGRFGADGCRTVTYAVIDSDSLVGHATRKLAYTDYTPTRFSMDKPLSFETVMELYNSNKLIEHEDPEESSYYVGMGRINLYDSKRA